MKEFLSEKKSAFQAKIRGFVNKLDSKIEPTKGNKIYKIFKIISLVMILVGIPLCAVSFGIFVLDGGPTIVIVITMWTLFAILMISLLGWFWFSKFNDNSKN